MIDITDRVDDVMIRALVEMKTLQAQSLLDEMARSDNETRASMAMNASLEQRRK